MRERKGIGSEYIMTCREDDFNEAVRNLTAG